MKEKKELRKRTVKVIREKVGTSCKVFWTNLRVKRKERRVRRMKNDEVRMVGGGGGGGR